MSVQRGFLFAGLVHLILVTCSACQFNVVSKVRVVDLPARFYMALSGADGYYGFFAPVVDPEIRFRFRLTDGEGREEFVTLNDGATAEANLRLAGAARLFRTSPERQEPLFRSAAAAVLAKHPHAEEVTIMIESYGVVRPTRGIDLPTMAEWRSGVRSEWQTLQAVSFERPKERVVGGRVSKSDKVASNESVSDRTRECQLKGTTTREQTDDEFRRSR